MTIKFGACADQFGMGPVSFRANLTLDIKADDLIEAGRENQAAAVSGPVCDAYQMTKGGRNGE
jgi:hypothetical protein